MKTRTKYIKPTKIRALAHAQGKRVSRTFIEAADRAIENMVLAACRVHNGGSKTLNAFLAAHVGFKV